MGVKTTPLTEHSRFMDSFEEKTSPHDFSDADNVGSTDGEQTIRRVRIVLKDLQTHGFTDH